MIPTLAAALLLAQASPLPAQTPPRTVHASGEGRISVAPDIARVTIGVDAQDQSLARANADATTRMGKVMGTLEKAGVAAKDVRTIRYAVDVQRSFEVDHRRRHRLPRGQPGARHRPRPPPPRWLA